MPTERKTISPANSHKTIGYSHAIATTGGTTIYIAGQVAQDIDGNVVGAGDFAAQARQVFVNLQAALEAAGGGFSNVVKMTTFIVNYQADQLPALREVRAQYLPATDPPASTLVGVAALARPEFLIEVEAIAVV